MSVVTRMSGNSGMEGVDMKQAARSNGGIQWRRSMMAANENRGEAAE